MTQVPQNGSSSAFPRSAAPRPGWQPGRRWQRCCALSAATAPTLPISRCARQPPARAHRIRSGRGRGDGDGRPGGDPAVHPSRPDCRRDASCQAHRRPGDCDRRHRRHLAARARHRDTERPRGGHAVPRHGSSAAHRPRRGRASPAGSDGSDTRRRVHGTRHGKARCPRTQLFLRCGPRAALRPGCTNIHGRVRWPCDGPLFVPHRTQSRVAHGGARRQRLRLPHRSAPATRPSRDTARCRLARSDHLLREHGPELGACRNDQGAPGSRRPGAWQRIPRGDPLLRLAPRPGLRRGRRHPRYEAPHRRVQGRRVGRRCRPACAHRRPQREAGRRRHTRDRVPGADPPARMGRPRSGIAGAHDAGRIAHAGSRRPRAAQCRRGNWAPPTASFAASSIAFR